jgi:colanic acid biosynthesis glycosyl transferase WcaI
MAGELARAWVKAGHEVTVVAPLPNRPHGKRYPGYPTRPWTVYTFEGIRCIRLWSWLIGNDRRPLSRLLENITFGVNSAIALLLARRPDVVILESWPVLATAAAMFVCMVRNVKTVNYIKDIYPEAALAAGVLQKGRIATYLLAIDRWVCRRATCNVVISKGAAIFVGDSRDVPSQKVRVICDWLDLSLIAPADGGQTWREEHGFANDERIFMFAGTLGYASRVDVLVDVAEKLRTFEKIRLVCVGHGPLKSRIEEEILTRGLKNLRLLPYQPREKVSQMQSAADVMLLTTSAQVGSTSVPNKLITYLAVGKPVICSVPADTDVAALVHEEQVGIVVPPEAPDAIAAAITQFAATAAGDLAAAGQRARAVALKRYSLDSAIAHFDELFRAIGARG